MPQTEYANALARSLDDRAGSLGQYIRSLQASNSRSDDAYNAALELFYAYTQAIIKQVSSDMSLGPSPALSGILESRLQDFFQKEQLFDQRFARGGQSEVPRALHTLARRELRALGLDAYEAVLTVGPPDSFETHRADLATYLFQDFRLDGRRVSPPLALQKLAVVSVPYIEGTRALWFPICLGHELAHIRLEHTKNTDLQLPDFGTSVDEADHDLVVLMDDADGHLEPGAGLGRIEHLRSQLRLWTDELACDLNAVRTFGPAGLSSIAEFLSTLRLEPTDTHRMTPQQASRTHPSLRTRVDVMARLLEQTGFTSGVSYLDAWKHHAQATEGRQPTRAATYLTSIILERQDEIIEHVLSWGPLGFTPRSFPVTKWLAERLISGIPGGTHFRDDDGVSIPVNVPDVVNASWLAREMLESPNGDLAIQKVSDYEARRTVDQLASKAIDDLEFCALWEMAGREVIDFNTLENPGLAPAGGILSRQVIASRMHTQVSGKTLTITPLLDGAIQDSGIDLRLGADFIVFRHSATSVFDPVALDEGLGHSEDPRKVQEKVTKSWGEAFILHPGELVLASTMEYIVLPEDIAAQVVTRSSYGRLGLITATAVQVQPGSRNCITLELVNHGATPIALMPGTRIAQLVFTHVPHSLPPSEGKYWHPTGPEFSKVRSDKDALAIRTVAKMAQWSPSRNGRRREGNDVPFEYVGSLKAAYSIHCLLETKSLPSEFSMFRRDPGETDQVFLPDFNYMVKASAPVRASSFALIDIVRNSQAGMSASFVDGTLRLENSVSVGPGLFRVTNESGSFELNLNDPDSQAVLQRILGARRGADDGRWRDI